MASGPNVVNAAHPSFSGLAFARRATAEGYRLRAIATDDPGIRKLHEVLAASYERLADNLDRAAQTIKRIHASAEKVGSRPPELPSND
jgi:hypothetical protein